MSDYGKVVKTVYFVRHGESEHNAQPIIQADSSPLSNRGHQQAQTVGKRLVISCAHSISGHSLAIN